MLSINHPNLFSESLCKAGLYPSVRWYHVGASGVDKLLPWTSSDVLVSNGAGVLAKYLADSVIGAILAMNNQLSIYQK